eukprot:COSAG01_NODE_5460_length_4252_cov_7.235974_3_plen_58_part_00
MGLHFNTHVDAKRHPHVIARYINDNLLGPRAEVQGGRPAPHVGRGERLELDQHKMRG